MLIMRRAMARQNYCPFCENADIKKVGGFLSPRTILAIGKRRKRDV